MKFFALCLLAGFAMLTGCSSISPMVAKTTADGENWVLYAPLKYTDSKLKKEVTVPRGFVTDFASVPRLFWVAFPPCGRYTPAAVVHDYLYWQQSPLCDRKCADDVLDTAMKESGVDFATRNAIYLAVRTAGQSAWDKNQLAKNSGVIRQVPEAFMSFGGDVTWSQLSSRILTNDGGRP